MSLKSKLLQYGGIAATFIPYVGPVLGPTMMAVGSNMAKQEAADKATAQQMEAGDKALGVTSEMYQQSRADMAPFRNTGAAAMGTLGSLMGLPSNGGSEAPQEAGPAPLPDAQQQQLTPLQASWFTRELPDGFLAKMENARQMESTQNARTAATQSSMAPSAPLGQAQGMVRVKSPDGRIVMVPANRVNEATRMGGALVA